MLTDEWFAGVLESDKREAQRIVQALQQRHGVDWVDTTNRISAAGAPDNPFKKNLVRACDIPEAGEIVRIWFGLYPRSVVLMVGESNAGKSSLLYNICVHAARNEPLFGVPFGLGRPLRVLYVDPENSGNFSEGEGGQCATKLATIGQGVPQDLHFHTGDGVNLANTAHVAALKELIEEYKYDLVVLDPLANLFGVKDENDNAEAARQMTAMTTLSRQTGACILVVHHTGKLASDYGRGASSRLAAADVSLTWRSKIDTEEIDDTFQGETRERDDFCRLQIVKNRRQGRGSLYLQMAGRDRFVMSSFEAWRTGGPSRGGQRDEVRSATLAEEEIQGFLADGQWRKRTEIVDSLRSQKIGRNAADTALEILEKSEVVVCQRGVNNTKRYILKSMSSQADFGFPVSLPPIGEEGNRETEKDKKAGKSAVVDGFMADSSGAVQEGEEGWE